MERATFRCALKTRAAPNLSAAQHRGQSAAYRASWTHRTSASSTSRRTAAAAQHLAARTTCLRLRTRSAEKHFLPLPKLLLRLKHLPLCCRREVRDGRAAFIWKKVFDRANRYIGLPVCGGRPAAANSTRTVTSSLICRSLRLRDTSVTPTPQSRHAHREEHHT